MSHSSRCCETLAKSYLFNFLQALCYALATAAANYLAMRDAWDKEKGGIYAPFSNHPFPGSMVTSFALTTGISTFFVYMFSRNLSLERLRHEPKKRAQTPIPAEKINWNGGKYGNYYCCSPKYYHYSSTFLGWLSVVLVGTVFFAGTGYSSYLATSLITDNNKIKNAVSLTVATIAALTGSIGFYASTVPQMFKRNEAFLKKNDKGRTIYQDHPWIQNFFNPQQAFAYAARAFFSTFVLYHYMRRVITNSDDNTPPSGPLAIAIYCFAVLNIASSFQTALGSRGNNAIKIQRKIGEIYHRSFSETNKKQKLLLGVFLFVSAIYTGSMILAAPHMIYSIFSNAATIFVGEELTKSLTANILSVGLSFYFTTYKVWFDVLLYNVVKTTQDYLNLNRDIKSHSSSGSDDGRAPLLPSEEKGNIRNYSQEEAARIGEPLPKLGIRSPGR